MSRVLVEYGGSTRALEARAGESLLELLRRSGFPVTAACGGNGTCGKCKVRLGDGREVLACRTPAEECRVIIEENGGGVICTESAATVCSVEAREGLGAAVDIGTTTVAVKLFDLRNGRELGVKSAWNAQTPYGADVITRCQTIMEHEDGLKRLSGLIREQVFGMAEELSRGEKIDEFFIAGNTVMEHIFMGLSPVSIAAAPFKPLRLFDGGEVFRERDAAVVCAPCVAGYVGGDITAGLLASGLFEKDECSLFLDVGTNGEMALGGRDGFLCCAVASGPAFEGAGVSCGMASADGAISRVRWGQGGPDFQVIGGGEAKGICGSGLLDLLAMLLKLKIVDETGAKIDIDDTGRIFIAAVNSESAYKAIEMIEGITAEAEPGKIYTGKVTRLMNFGAFVEILPGKEGLVHISQLSTEHVDKVEDVVSVGDEIVVKVTEIDNKGRINLSRKAFLMKGMQK